MNFVDHSARIGDSASAIGSQDPLFVLLLIAVTLSFASLLLLVMTLRSQGRSRRKELADPAERERLFREIALISQAITCLADEFAASPIKALSAELQELRGAFAQAMTSVASGVASRSNAQLQQQKGSLRQIAALEQAVRDLEARLATGQVMLPALRPPAHFSTEIAQIVRDLQNGPS